MSKSIAAMHVAKKELGLDDDTYRAALVQVTGKSSSADMTEPERQKVMEHFRASGFKGTATGSRKRLDGKFAPKLQALWIAGWNLGLVRDRDDRALIAFVKRQTGIDHVRFVRHGQDAMKAIEALKGWLARAGGVDWSEDQDPANCVVRAQLRLIGREGAEAVAGALIALWENGFASATDRQSLMNTLGDGLRALPAGAGR